MHPMDRLEALEWAVEKAILAAQDSDILRLTVLPALREMRDEARAEARK